MKVFTCTEVINPYDSPMCAVVVAENEEQARQMLRDRFAGALARFPNRSSDVTFPLEELDVSNAQITVLEAGH